MDHIAVDLKEFIPSARYNKYLLVIVDVCTRFVFLRAIPNKTMHTVGACLFALFCDVGFPRIIQFDNGAEFVNSLISALVSNANIDQRLITPYNPRANGLAERFVQTATQSILKELEGKDDQWDLHFQSVQFFINVRVAKVHGSSPFSLFFARHVNGFDDYSKTESCLLPASQLQQRVNYMASIVYPTIAAKVAQLKKKEGVAFIIKSSKCYNNRQIPERKSSDGKR